MSQSIANLVDKARAGLKAGKTLDEVLTRPELIILKRNYKSYKINKAYPAQFEFEFWTGLNHYELKDLVRKFDKTIPISGISSNYSDDSYYDDDYYDDETEEYDRVVRTDTSPIVESTRWPYTHWYFHSDCSISVDQEKMRKLAEESKFPIKVQIRENSSYLGSSLINVLADTPTDTPFSLKIKEIVKREAAPLIAIVKNLNQKMSTISLANNTTIIATLQYQAVELSSPTLYNLRHTRSLFHIFKCKGPGDSPLAFVNKSCGLHVTFKWPVGDAATKVAVQLRMAQLFYALEKQIFEIVPDHRRNNTYARPVSTTFSNPEDFLNRTSKYNALYLEKNYDYLEFRFMNGTSNVNTIDMWIKFLSQIYMYAVNLDKPITPTIHLFDVVTNLHLQNWYIKRKRFLNNKAVLDKATPLNAITFVNPIKTEIKYDTKKSSNLPPVISQKKFYFSSNVRGMNNLIGKRKQFPRSARQR